jgi:uncharacterized protein (DUF2252 family)
MMSRKETRSDLLCAARNRKMARSVHAYVRGNTLKFYDWLDASPVAAEIPMGPPIWICGDCHVGNLGPVADAKGDVAFQIRDLDQAVIGNPALDLVRLGLSLETAARSSDLPGVTTANMIEAMAQSYVSALRRDRDDGGIAEPDVVRTVRKRAVARHWRHLAAERIDGTDPDLPLGKRFWKLAADERSAIDGLFEDPIVRARALDLAGVGAKTRLRVVDAAFWKKGCSSLGNLRYAVLLGFREKGRDEFLGLVDIKEAVASITPSQPGAVMPKDHAERVVAGALALAPNLGSRMVAATLLGRPVVMRELKPQDLKLELEQFSRKEAVSAAAYLAFVVGRAHARQLDAKQKAAWAEAFGRRRDPAIDAPSWLWRAVVDLAGTHEMGYLDHCRAYAVAA